MSDNPYVTSSNVESDFPPLAEAPQKRTPRKRGSPPPNYQFVRIGLWIVYVAMIGLFLGLMSYLIYLFSFLGVGNFQNVSPLAMLGFQVGSGVISLLQFVGFCFCCAAPKKSERDKIQIVVVLQIVTFLIAVGGAFFISWAIGTNSDMERAAIALLVFFFAQILSAISLFVFISFCKELGVGSHPVTDATARAQLWLTLVVASLVITWALLISLVVSPPTENSLIRNLFMLLMSLATIGSTITYSLMSISMVQKTLDYVSENAIQARFKKLPRQHKKKAQQLGEATET